MVIASELSSVVTPTALGGAPVKISLLMSEGISLGKAVCITSFGSIEDALFLILNIPMVIFVISQHQYPFINHIIKSIHLSQTVWIVSIIMLTGWLITKIAIIKKTVIYRKLADFFIKIKPAIQEHIGEIKRALAQIQQTGGVCFALAFSLSIMQWICRFSIIAVIAWSLGLQISFLEFFVLQWIVYMFMCVFPLPGGSGGAEAAFYFIYQSLIPLEIIGVLMIGWRFITFYLVLLLDLALIALLNGFSTSILEREIV